MKENTSLYNRLDDVQLSKLINYQLSENKLYMIANFITFTQLFALMILSNILFNKKHRISRVGWVEERNPTKEYE